MILPQKPSSWVRLLVILKEFLLLLNAFCQTEEECRPWVLPVWVCIQIGWQRRPKSKFLENILKMAFVHLYMNEFFTWTFFVSKKPVWKINCYRLIISKWLPNILMKLCYFLLCFLRLDACNYSRVLKPQINLWRLLHPPKASFFHSFSQCNQHFFCQHRILEKVHSIMLFLLRFKISSNEIRVSNALFVVLQRT